jgi:hypothetical protein
MSYKKRLTIASSEMVTHRDLLQIIEDAVETGNPLLLDQWLKRVSDWEDAPPFEECPYIPQHKCECRFPYTASFFYLTKPPVPVDSLDIVRARLDADEKMRAGQDDNFASSAPSSTISGFVAAAFSAQAKR